jgi:hypothetical protein
MKNGYDDSTMQCEMIKFFETCALRPVPSSRKKELVIEE